MSECKNGRFRKKKMNFAMVSNEVLRDRTLSLKAKGLFALIESYISLDDFVLYKSFLMSNCAEGRKSFDSSWRELKSKGYLIQYRMKDSKNQFYYEYELVDSIEKPLPQNGTPGKFSVVPFQATAESDSFKTDVAGNGGNINNTDEKNTNKNKTNINHIFSEDEVRERLDCKMIKNSTIDAVVMLVTEVLNMDDTAVLRINQQITPVKLVKARFLQLRHEHIDYILVSLADYEGSIKSIRNFMITVIYNAVPMCDLYFTQRVKVESV